MSNHLSAFANNPGGGFLVFGIDNKTRQPVGINTQDSERVITTLSNRARGTLNPEVIIEHEKQRAMISRLIKEALAAKVIKAKDINSKSSKHIEYIPYWA